MDIWYTSSINEFNERQIHCKALEEIRLRAVKRVEAGESHEAGMKVLTPTRPCVYE